MKKTIKKIGLLGLFYTLSCIQIVTTFAAGTDAPGESTKITVELNEPIGDVAIVQSETAMGFIVQYLRIMYNYGAAMVGIICVLVIAVSGMQYAFNSESAEEAKKRIINSLSGLAVLFLSAIFLYFINPNFFQAG
ncbi:MAG: hypothetical protein Q8P68_02030 [Candidatus Peregrinibacteria bacterium]|nr:hypothetical protein [Candidatus Peregrinibacteria bacterium]MDZ4244539.1 hypothetical protein [Candidatus Gracilibacteria bacterium]